MTKFSLFRPHTPADVYKGYKHVRVIQCDSDDMLRIPNRWTDESRKYVFVMGVPEEALTILKLQGWYIRNVSMDEFHIKLLSHLI